MQESHVPWKKVTLVGVGLLGGSLGLALRKRCLAERVVGYVRRATTISECERAGAVDEAVCDLAEAVADADLVVLCTPVAQMSDLMLRMVPSLKRGAVITDVGSVKRQVVRDLERMAAEAGAAFVGSHPMAGSEKTGVSAARADLFVHAISVVTPTSRSKPAALLAVEQLWRDVGAKVLRMSAAKHDALVSRSSHLPYVLAASLASLVLDPSWPREQTLLCAGGFRDTTRIASGSPEMWRDILLTNADYVGRALAQLRKRLDIVAEATAKGDGRKLQRLFEAAKQRRDAWSNAAASKSPE